MQPQRSHLLEKIQVGVVTAALVAFVYFVLFPALRPDDPNEALSFVTNGGFVPAALFAAAMCGMAVVVGAVTVSVRPSGAMLSVVAAAAALSVRSPQMRSLMWLQSQSLSGFYIKLAFELVIVFAILAAACGILAGIRQLVAKMRPKLLWADPLPVTTRDPDVKSKESERRNELKNTAAGLLLSGAIATILVLSLLRRADRGQVIFSLAAGFAVATGVADQLSRIKRSFFVLVAPFALGLFLYALAAVGASGELPEAWANTQMYARALPIDWLSAGGGGALLGHWVSTRLREMRFFERQKAKEA